MPPDPTKLELAIDALRSEIARLREELRAHTQVGHATDGGGASDTGARGQGKITLLAHSIDPA